MVTGESVSNADGEEWVDLGWILETDIMGLTDALILFPTSLSSVFSHLMITNRCKNIYKGKHTLNFDANSLVIESMFLYLRLEIIHLAADDTEIFSQSELYI